MSKYDFIATSRPINRIAGQVLTKGESSPEIHYEESYYHSEAPTKTIKFTGKPKDNLKNKRFGNLVVIGFMGKNASGMGVWLVRCDCGYYEKRTGKYLKKSGRNNSACKECCSRKGYSDKYSSVKRRGCGETNNQKNNK